MFHYQLQSKKFRIVYFRNVHNETLQFLILKLNMKTALAFGTDETLIFYKASCNIWFNLPPKEFSY